MDAEKNIITLPGQEGNPVATPTPLQAAMTPYLGDIALFWWVVWLGTLSYVLLTYIIIPVIKRMKK